MNTYWHIGEKDNIPNKRVDDFLSDLMWLYEKHGFSIAHEDDHGAFIIDNYSVSNCDWIKGCIEDN